MALRKFGSPHLYVQGAGALDELPAVVEQSGRIPLLVADSVVLGEGVLVVHLEHDRFLPHVVGGQLRDESFKTDEKIFGFDRDKNIFVNFTSKEL